MLFEIVSLILQSLFAFVLLVEFLKKNFTRWEDCVSFCSDFIIRVQGICRRDDQFNYNIGYASDGIEALVTANSGRVIDWCKSLSSDFMEEVDRPCIISIFHPHSQNQNKKKKVSKRSFLIILMAPNRCLIFRLNHGTLVPIQLRKLFENPNLTLFVDSLVKLKKVMNQHSPTKWIVPKTVIDLPDLLRRSSPNISQEFDSLKVALGILNSFKYVTPRGVLASNWEKRKLSDKQVQFLVMQAYSALLMARKKRFTRWPIASITEDESESPGKDSVAEVVTYDDALSGPVPFIRRTKSMP